MEELNKQSLKDIAHSVRTQYMEVSDVYLEWPDCYDISVSIKRTLQDDFEVSTDNIRIKEYILQGGLHHYAVVVTPEVIGESAVIDASFDQFSSETDTALNIADSPEIEPVVVAVPKEKYIFNNY